MGSKIRRYLVMCRALDVSPWWDWPAAHREMERKIDALSCRIVAASFAAEDSGYREDGAWLSAIVLYECPMSPNDTSQANPSQKSPEGQCLTHTSTRD